MKHVCFSILILLTSISSISSIAQSSTINEENYILIEGIEQWVTIQTDDILKPVILFIHGGPRSTMSQYGDAM